MTEHINWYRSPVPKETLKDLTQRSNGLGLVQMIGQLLLSTLTGISVYLAYCYLSWPFVIAAIYIHGMFFSLMGPPAAVHELSHRTVFKTRTLNEIFIRICSFLTWTNFVKFRASHERHHMLTVHSGRDLEVVLPNPIAPWKWTVLSMIHVFDLIGTPGYGRNSGVGTTIRQSLGILKGTWEYRLFPESNPKARHQLANWARTMLAGHIVLATIFLALDLWILLFIITFPSFIAPWLSLLFTHPQHTGLKPDVRDFRICCRTILLNRFERFLYWNMNYHIEHHMYAAVPFYNLPKLRAAIESDLPVAPRGLIATWKELAGIMARQLKVPEYCVIPEIPGPRTE